jgi:hypothetical protein
VILITISAIHLRYTPETAMASSSSTNPAYSVLAFNGHERLIRIHQEITDLLHYQSHVHLTTALHLPPSTRTANQQEQEAIIEFLKEERARIQTLQALLDMAENNDIELQGLYKDSPVTADADWGTFAWGPMLQWEEPPLQGLYKDSPVTADADWGTFAWGPMPQWEEPLPADDPPPA